MVRVAAIKDLIETLEDIRSKQKRLRGVKYNSVDVTIDAGGSDDIYTKIPVQNLLEGLAVMEKAIVDQLALHNIEV